MAEVVLLIGLQACGKSTFHAATHVLVSRDAMPRSARREEARLIRAPVTVGPSY